MLVETPGLCSLNISCEGFSILPAAPLTLMDLDPHGLFLGLPNPAEQSMVKKTGILPGRHRECPSDHHRHLGTPQGRKERRSGQGRLAADTSLRTVLLGE